MDYSNRQNEVANPPRRPRAPTITIDTTEINTPAATVLRSEGPDARQFSQSPRSYMVDEAHSPSTTGEHLANSWTSHQRSLSGQQPDELQHPLSFDSRDSRPTSPHNVSSPIMARGNGPMQGYLAVPSNLRSRQNSVDSEDGSHSIASSQGETMIASASAPGPLGSSDTSQNQKIMSDDNALKADQGREAEFKIEDNPFAFSPGMLNKMFNPKSLAAFWRMGGLSGIEKGLRSDRKAGLSVDETRLDGCVLFEQVAAGPAKEVAINSVLSQSASPTTHRKDAADRPFASRMRVYGDNRLPLKNAKSLAQLMWVTYNDKVLILLSMAGVVSLAIGLYQTFGTSHTATRPPVEWVEGVAIIVAIVIVVLVGSLNDWQKERQFAHLNKKKQDRVVKVVRSGRTMEMSVLDVLVGDVMHLEPGDMVPVDGLLIEGFNVRCDESQATGESDIIKKRPADDVFHAIESHQDLKKMDPFIQSGAHVMEGIGTFMVTSTGLNSSYGRTLVALTDDPEITPLQSKLNVIAEYIAKLGGAAGLLLFIILFIMFLVRLKSDRNETAAQKGQNFLNIFIIIVTIIVVAVPEGLPLAVTLALAYATNRMLKDNNLVRHLKACEVMGNATTICSDKTGTLTQNKMQVVAGTIGTVHRFGGLSPPIGGSLKTPRETDITASDLADMLDGSVKQLLKDSIALNSTAFEGEREGQKTFIGSKTETALLTFATDHLSMGLVSEERANAKILQVFPFDSGRKCMGVVIQLPNGKARLHVKGASEIMLAKCTQIVRDPSQDMAASALTEDNNETVNSLIKSYASHSLRTIAIIYRDLERWPPRMARRADGDKDEVCLDDVCKHMVFVAMVGIKDSLRPGVPEAVATCQRAGVVVRMVTGDNKLTAEAIARDCGILQPDSIVMEGPEFRNLSKTEMDNIIPRLHVLARSSPQDKRILVKRLKEKGETVAVTGDGTNDAPALKLADVGFSMGLSGTEVAKEASAIILMDDNFTSIVQALKWGRAVSDAVKRFLQFQLTVNVTAVVLTFVTAIASDSEDSVLTAVQLLWVNLIMDTLAALALATDPPQDSVVDRKPERKGASIISTTMWKMILGQAFYQLLITLLLYFGKEKVTPANDEYNADQTQTLIFNTFVWMQIFNQWNNRRLDNRFNIFEGMTKNKLFLAVNLAMCGAQVLIVFVGGRAFNIASEGQSAAMWAYALVLGLLSLPIAVVIRLVPDSLLESLVPEYLKRKAHASVPGLTVSDEERFNYYPTPLADVRNELAFLKRVKGGRLNNLKFAIQNPRESILRRSPIPSREHSISTSINRIPQTPTREDSFGSHSGIQVSTPESRKWSKSMRSRSNSALGATTVMAGIIGGSVGIGWSPIDRRAPEPDFSQAPPSGTSHQRSQSDGCAQSQSGNPQLALGGQALVAELQDMTSEAALGTGANQEPALPLLKLPVPKSAKSPIAEEKAGKISEESSS